MEPSVIVIAIDGPIDRARIPALCDRVREMLEHSDHGGVICDVGALTVPDAATVEVLARLQLTAGRLGLRVRLSHAVPDLVELLSLVGLRGVLPLDGPSGVEPGRQAE